MDEPAERLNRTDGGLDQDWPRARALAHDLAALLAVIAAAAETVAARGESPATLADCAEIAAAVARAAALTRAVSGEVARPLAVDAALRALLPLLGRLAGPRIPVTAEFAAGDGWAAIAPVSLDRVVVNLVVNARDALLVDRRSAMGQGAPAGPGRIWLRSSCVELERTLAAVPAAVPPGRYVRIEVADDGPGIAPDLAARIFEPGVTTKPGGGLGLAIVREELRVAGGFVTVGRGVDRGGRLALFLPWVPAPPELPVAAPAGSTGAGQGRTVLLVEDEAPLRRLAAAALTRAGWVVLAAESAEEALTLIPDAAPKLLISDLVLPGLDGRALAARLRVRWPLLRVLLVSGYGRRASLAEAGIEVMEKPYPLAALVDWAGAM